MINIDCKKSCELADVPAVKKLPRAVLPLFATIFVLLGFVSLFSLAEDTQQTFTPAAYRLAAVVLYVIASLFIRSSIRYSQKTYC